MEQSKSSMSRLQLLTHINLMTTWQVRRHVWGDWES